jgi:hypothetical protein
VVDFEIMNEGGDDIEDDLDSIILNALAIIISKWWRFKFLRWTQF